MSLDFIGEIRGGIKCAAYRWYTIGYHQFQTNKNKYRYMAISSEIWVLCVFVSTFLPT